MIVNERFFYTEVFEADRPVRREPTIAGCVLITLALAIAAYVLLVLYFVAFPSSI